MQPSGTITRARWLVVGIDSAGWRRHPVANVRMKGIRILVAAITFFCSYAAGAGVEITKDVGFGFRLVIRSEQTGPGAFESIAQYGYFFYKDRELDSRGGTNVCFDALPGIGRRLGRRLLWVEAV